MPVNEESLRDFLIEHYKQVNEHLRESDRNRNILLGIYLGLVTGILSFCLSLNNQPLSVIMLGLLFILGVMIAIYTTIARAWHCEYTSAAMAIHRSFLDGDLDPFKTAKKLKEAKKFGPYFNRRGTEFMVMVFLLIIISAELGLLIWQACAHLSLWPLWSRILLALAGFVLSLIFGYVKYKQFLYKRESEFPEQSWCILVKEIGREEIS